MSEYEVTIHRIETREVTIKVSAMSESDAEEFARAQAGDINFAGHASIDVKYEYPYVELITPDRRCNECDEIRDEFMVFPSGRQVCGFCMKAALETKA